MHNGFCCILKRKKSKAHERKFGLCCNKEKDKRMHTKKKHTNEWTEKQSQKLIFHKLRTKKKTRYTKEDQINYPFRSFFHVDNKVRSRQMSNEILNRSDWTHKFSTTTTENAMNANLFSHYLELYRSESRKITIEIRFELIVCFINKCTFFSAHSCYLIVFFWGKMILGLKIWFS